MYNNKKKNMKQTLKWYLIDAEIIYDLPQDK